jgi:fluoride exporter
VGGVGAGGGAGARPRPAHDPDAMVEERARPAGGPGAGEVRP